MTGNQGLVGKLLLIQLSIIAAGLLPAADILPIALIPLFHDEAHLLVLTEVSLSVVNKWITPQ